MSSAYDSIMAGTQVQEVKTRLRGNQEDFERRVAEIVGAEATGQGWDAPGFEAYKDMIERHREICEQIANLAAERVAENVEKARDAQ